jgi:poly-gamma-glutamate synthesis protein (capsule biosynthesis protein)
MTQAVTVRLMLTGDNVVFSGAAEPSFYYERVAPVLREADIRFGNLEWPLSSQYPLDAAKEASYAAMGAQTTSSRPTLRGARMDPAAVGMLRLAGYDAVGLANNHHMDYGAEGSAETTRVLDVAGILHTGAGRNLTEARQPAIVERNGARVAFLAFTSVLLPSFAATDERPGVAAIRVQTLYAPSSRVTEQPGSPMETRTVVEPGDLQALTESITDARRRADVVVASMHWGVSVGWANGPVYGKRVPYQMDLGRACIDAGASLVIGHHPHLLQGIERYRDGVICYSLGNFVFAGGRSGKNEFDRETAIAEAVFAGPRLERFALVPVLHNDDQQPEPVDCERGREVFYALKRDSKEFGTAFSLERERIVVCL